MAAKRPPGIVSAVATEAKSEELAPHGFRIYFRNEVSRVMGAAGNHAQCISYLMGNHTIAERMYRHDPRVMLYAPLHTAAAEGSAAR